MPFQYTPYTSPYTSAIAELIGQRGNIAAQQAQNRSALVGNITNAVTKSLGDILQYKMDAPKREMEALQLANAKQAAADAAENRSAATLYGNLISSNYSPGYERQGPSATSATGTLPTYGDMTTKIGDVTLIDKDKVLKAMAQAGHGAWALDHSDKIDALNTSKIELNNAKNTVLQRAALTYATLPAPLKLQGAQTILDTLHGSGVLPKEQEALFVSQLQTGDTSGIDAAVRQYLPPPTMMKVGQGEDVVAVGSSGTTTTVYQGQPKPVTTPKETSEEKRIRLGMQSRSGQSLSKEDAAWAAEYDAQHASKENLTIVPQYDAEGNPVGSMAVSTRTGQARPVTGADGQPLVTRGRIGAGERTRLDTAKTLVTQEQEFLKQLNDPEFVKKLGPVLGRMNSLSSDIGIDDPDVARFIGRVKSFAQGNNTVHGARNYAAQMQIQDLLGLKHNPASLKAALEGITEFSHDLLKNSGVSDPSRPTAPQGGAAPKFRYNPATGKLDPIQ